jgi:hypothetical protein
MSLKDDSERGRKVGRVKSGQIRSISKIRIDEKTERSQSIESERE